MRKFDNKEYLTDLCLNVRNHANAISGYKRMPERAKWIVSRLNELNVPVSVDSFKMNSLPLYNIIARPTKSKRKKSLLFTAHHDVLNIRSQNCLDNSASVVNLIDLSDRLNNNDIDKNIIVVFTDGEECGGLGATRLSQQINSGIGNFGDVISIINLELTAVGNGLWIDKHDSKNIFGKLKCEIVQTPFNDSYIYRQNKIDSICVGILPLNHNAIIDKNYWRYCHSSEDTIELSNFKEMIVFVESLLNLALKRR